MIPVSLSNGSGSIGSNLPPLFLEDFIAPGAGAGPNLIPYCGPNTSGHSADDTTVTSWYLNLPPPPAPSLPSSISLLSNHSITTPNIDSFISYPQNTSAVITLPTNSSLEPPICTIKPQDQLLSKIETQCITQTGLMSSLSSKYSNFLLVIAFISVFK